MKSIAAACLITGMQYTIIANAIKECLNTFNLFQ